MLERGCSFDSVTHSYSNNGIVVPSCTRVLDHSGLVSYDMVRREILERKGTIGRLVHLATQYYDENNLEWSSLDDATKGRTEAWMKFREDTGFVPNKIEERYIATVNGMTFGLTVDREGQFRRHPAVVELKTSAAYQRWWGVQLSGYAMGVPDHEGNIRSPLALFASRRRVAVQLFSNGKYKKFDFDEPTDVDVFLSCLHITHWKLKNGENFRKLNLEEAA